jgi:hypothetical protein
MIRDSNKMKYYPPFFFCLDDTDTKNKKMNDSNTEILKDMTLFRNLAMIPTGANLVIMWSCNPQSR